jgi:transcriptional regulator with XRE-family HTH domain
VKQVTQLLSPLADCRQAAGYTQASLAKEIRVDRTTVGRWERGSQPPQPWQRPKLAAALNLTLEQLNELIRQTKEIHDAALVGTATDVAASQFPAVPTVVPKAIFAARDDSDGSAVGDAFSDHDAVHAAMPRLRRALDNIDLPDDGPVRPMRELATDVDAIIEHRVQARYIPLAWRVPDLIAELARAKADPRAGRSRQAAGLLTLALRAADGTAFKFGYLDLSARIIDLMNVMAQAAANPLLMATVAYVRTETFFASGDLAAASRSLVAAADNLPTSEDSAPAAAVFGALHMRAAVVAARDGQADAAWDHIAEARRAATQVPEGVYHGTAFGPSSVRIHELAVAVELGDNTTILRRATTWHPPTPLPAERRSHYYIDLGRALLRLGRHEDAYHCLQTARTIAPQHTRDHPQVRQTLSALLRTHRSPSDGLLGLAAWTRAR